MLNQLSKVEQSNDREDIDQVRKLLFDDIRKASSQYSPLY